MRRGIIPSFRNLPFIFFIFALAMKKGLSEDSPKSKIYAFSEFLRVKEKEAEGAGCLFITVKNIFYLISAR